MDFLDPKKSRRQMILLFSGYILIGAAVLIGATILLYQAYGFGLNKKGEVIQNGLLFVSSQPSPASIYIDGKLNKAQTNSRILLTEGTYSLQLKRSGYRDWQRTVTVDGGKVDHFDYPFLIPTTLSSAVKQAYDAPPAFSTQSPDKRWLLVQLPASTVDFQLFDLKNPKLDPAAYTIPATAFTAATDTTLPQSWQLVSWANDNRHILLKHSFDNTYEYVMIDRTDAALDVNLSQTLRENPTELQLVNKRYDRYVLYEAADKTLKKATLANPAPVAYLQEVLAYKTYGDNDILYATPDAAHADKVKILLQLGTKAYTIRTVAANTTYLLDLASYSGDLYVVAGATNEDKVLIYKNPVDQIQDPNIKVAVQVRVLRVPAPNYLSFSDNARFVTIENGTAFAIYDFEDAKGFGYTSPDALDAPQVHASWMDGHRLQYVSAGKLLIFDYDDKNRQLLANALPGYLPVFNPQYTTLYTVAPQAKDATKAALTSTSLLIPADQ